MGGREGEGETEGETNMEILYRYSRTSENGVCNREIQVSLMTNVFQSFCNKPT